MTGATMTDALERRYRRLLTWYPAEHRRTYGEEMVGVLLASARPGQRWPGVADAFDLFGGGTRVRLRAVLAGSPDPGWQNTLATTTLIAPILLVALVHIGAIVWAPAYGTDGLAGLAAILLVPVTLGLLGPREAAVLAASATLIWMVVRAVIGQNLDDPSQAGYLVLLAVQALALAFSPGPQRALRLISPIGVLLAVPWMLTAAYIASVIPTHYQVPQAVDRIVIAVIALAGLSALATSAGRRLIVLIAAIPLSGLAGTILTFASINFYDMSLAAALVTLYLPPVLLGGLIVAVIRRSSRRPALPATEATA
jgi:hypothetical protein